MSLAGLPAADCVELSRRFRAGETSAVDIAESTIREIAERDGELHAFLTHNPDALRQEAHELDQKRARGEPLGVLAGVPIALKDALVTRGVRTTAGSRILESYVPPYDATVVARLRAADALLPGKTNLDELAMGSSTEHSAFGASKNPWDTSRSPGGSSGGSAVAVAARMTPGSLGSDTGGSIRQPAAFTGIVGVKPTYGRVSRFGLIAFASSLDQVGPFSTTVRASARILSVIAGGDRLDSTCLDAPVPDYEAACGGSIKGLRVGVPEQYFARGLDPEVEKSVRAAIGRLEQDGATVRALSLPHTKHAVATYYVLATAEASSNLARLDGVRFGLRVERAANAASATGAGGVADAVQAMYGQTREAGFGAEVKRRILLGTFVLSAGFYDAYYRKAEGVRALIRRDFELAFAEVDAIVSPTAPTPAFALGANIHDPLAMYLSDIYTLPASLAGLPALSVPVEPTAGGLPVGFQIMAPWLGEEMLFRLAAAVEAHAPPACTASSERLMPFNVRPLTPDLLDSWADLFRACASGCFCRYWHFEGTKNEWLARLAFDPATNEAEQRERLKEGHPSASGIVALSEGVVVGWMKLAPQEALGKLRRLPVYRSELSAKDAAAGVLGIGCFLVHPEHRRQGVARALLEGAITHARATGAGAIEAYPHLRNEPLREEELWMGPYALLEAAGFVNQGGNSAYPVMRLGLAVAPY